MTAEQQLGYINEYENYLDDNGDLFIPVFQYSYMNEVTDIVKVTKKELMEYKNSILRCE